MKRYRVRGTIELNWENEVNADSQEEALAIACEKVWDGYGLNIPVSNPDQDQCDVEVFVGGDWVDVRNDEDE